MTNGDPRCPNCGGYLANLGPEHMMFCCLQPKRSESVFSAPATTIPTDAGKRLSDAATLVTRLRVTEEREELRAHNMRSDPEETYALSSLIGEAADALERLTANRGSVSEDRAREILAQCYGKMYASRGEKPASIRAGENPSIPANAAIAAIQQAVSECSGGGASSSCPICGIDSPHKHWPPEIDAWIAAQASRFHRHVRVFDTAENAQSFYAASDAREDAEVLRDFGRRLAQAEDSFPRYSIRTDIDPDIERIAMLLESALPLPPSPVKDECDHPEVSREFVSGIRCGECGKTSLKETPPVKESRDAALIDELRGWKAGEKASDDTVRMIWIMNKAADALEGKLT